jgi:hypothetical protein
VENEDELLPCDFAGHPFNPPGENLETCGKISAGAPSHANFDHQLQQRRAFASL